MNAKPLLKNDDQQDFVEVISDIRAQTLAKRKIVFVSGNFNIVHPGHLRLLSFAASCGDYLVVGVNSDDHGTAILSASDRLTGISSIGIVDCAFILEAPPEQFVRALRPHIVVKGKEHEVLDNSEKIALDEYGGKLLFSSGEVRFSSLDILQRELLVSNLSAIKKPRDFPKRHKFRIENLIELVNKFQDTTVTVIGDVIVDDYINCEPLGMSREDPTLVVTPINKDRFIGGAAIVAAHARGLGARVNFFSIAGDDGIRDFANDELRRNNVECSLLKDESRPTTLKQRYRAGGNTLLRVSELRQHDIGEDIIEKLSASVSESLRSSDLLVFADFNYGCLPQQLVDRLVKQCASAEVMAVADSQASSQIGDISRFRHMRLLTPTEHEARLAVGDQKSGLVVLAEKLRLKASADHVIVTLGAEGLLIHAKEADGEKYITDRLPAMNRAPKDVSGAGDALLISGSLALAAGGSIWESAFLGAVAAACQVGRVGNRALSRSELLEELLR